MNLARRTIRSRHPLPAETKVQGANQTQVPAVLRAKFRVGLGDILVWEATAGGDVRIRFRRRHTLRERVGTLPAQGRGDTVRDKRRGHRREL